MRTHQRLIAGLFALCLCGYTSCNVSNFLKAYGYTELRPPSNLLAPGAMVAVISRSPYTAKIICGPRASLGSGWKPVESDTASSALKSQSNKTFNLSADVLTQITANAEFQFIRNITVTLTNARIVEIQDTDVYENMQYRSAECEAALNARRRANFEVSMVSSGLIGDIDYVISWSSEAKMDAKAKADVLQDLAIQLGGGASCVSENTISAKNLMYGIKDDIFLAAISLPDVDENQVKRGSRILDIDVQTVIDKDPDAPIVMPTNGQNGPAEPHPAKGNPQLGTRRRDK